jgi:hypothetical protein
MTFSAAPAWADWQVTFDPEAIGTYDFADHARFIVIAAGDVNGSRPAAEWLMYALRNAPSARRGELPATGGLGVSGLVMDDQSLGNVRDLDDKVIVQKVQNLRVDYIAIVRVFEGEPASVVVIVYDKAGETQWALSGNEGVPVARNRESGGVSARASSSVAAIGEVNNVSRAEALKRYDEEFIWFADFAAVSSQSGQVVSQWSKTYQGKYRKPLEGSEFYLALGRQDLAEEFSSNVKQQRLARWMGNTGLFLLLGAAVPWATYRWASGLNAHYAGTEHPGYTGPLILSGLSVGLLIGSIIAAPDRLHPVDLSESLRMVDEHNQKLKQELGIPEEYFPMSRVTDAPAATVAYDLDLIINHDGVKFVFRLDF